MFLPVLPNKITKLKRTQLEFGGLDLRENPGEGALRDSAGISTRAFPHLAVCGGSRKLTEYANPTDMFEHNGRLFVVDGEQLMCDGVPVCAVTSGIKQFAVVGRRLCIFPDKIAYDLRDGNVWYMERSMQIDLSRSPTRLNSGGLTVTPVRETVQTGKSQKFERTGLSGPFAYTCTYTYGTDKEALERCFKRGGWTDLQKNRRLKDICYNNTGEHLQTGDIVIPQKNADGEISIVGNPYKLINIDGELAVDPQYYPDEGLYNREGYYCVITSVDTDLDRGADTLVTYDVYKTDGADVLFESNFQIGDAVSIEGTPFGIKDARGVTVTDITAQTNTLVFAENAVRDAEYYCILSAQAAGSTPLTLEAGGRYVTFTPEKALDRGTLLYMGAVYTGDTGTTPTRKITVYLWDEQTKQTAGEFEASVSDTYVEGAVETIAYTLIEGSLTVRKPLPDLDFICESDNRLWGINRSENRVYASRRGAPDSFFDHGGTDGAWNMTFGSEDSFTAVCAFGGGVCCFKENKLHKILGTSPAQYYVSDYNMEGVAQGCERSLQIIGQQLYYKGVHGVYAYSGTAPKLVSAPLGELHLRSACAGTDGRIYYLSGQTDSGGMRYAFDLLHKIWVKESTEDTRAYACIDGMMYMLHSQGVFIHNLPDRSQSTYMLEFAPFCEDTLSKKTYTKLLFRVAMAAGSGLSVYLSTDGKDRIQVYTHTPDSDTTVTVPVRVQRCSSFSVRLEGRGDVKLTGMLRECAIMSEV